MRLSELQEKWDKAVLRLENRWRLVKRVDPQDATAKDTTRLDEYDGRATYEDYRGYYDASKKKKVSGHG